MVNQQFTFAVHIMTALAFRKGMMSSRSLAASVNTNPVVVRRLLLALRRAKLIKTYPGKNGGACLSRNAARISLLDIYCAVEPRAIIPANKRKAWRFCPVSCRMKQIMSMVAQGADAALREHLGAITLKDLAGKVAA